MLTEISKISKKSIQKQIPNLKLKDSTFLKTHSKYQFFDNALSSINTLAYSPKLHISDNLLVLCLNLWKCIGVPKGGSGGGSGHGPFVLEN